MGISSKLQILLEADPSSAIAGFKQLSNAAENELSKTESTLSKVGGGLTKFGGAAMATSAVALTGLAKLATGFSDLALDVEKNSLITGLSTESMSRWTEVAGDLGVSSDTLTGMFNKQNLAIEKSPGLFKEYNIEIAKTASGQTDVEQTTYNAIAAYQAIKDPAEKSAFAQQMWGKSWKDSAELINMGVPELKANLASVSDAKVITPEEVEKAKKLRAAMDTLKDSLEDLALGIGQGVAPVLAALAETVGTAVGWFSDFNEVTDGALGTIASIAAIAVGAGGGIAFIAGKVLGLVDNFTNAYKAVSTFVAANKGLSTGLGIAGAALGIAGIAYEVYTGRKEAAVKTTKDLRTALLEEKSAQADALAALAASDGGVKRFLETQDKLGISTAQVVQYVKDGTGPIADLNAEWVNIKETIDGTYPELEAFAKVLGVDLSKEGWDVAAAAARDFLNQTNDLNKAQQDAARTTDLVNKLTTETKTAYSGAGEAARNGASATDIAAKAMEEATQRADELAAADERTQRAIDTVTGAWERLTGALSADQAFIDIENTFDDVKTAAEESFIAAANGTADADQKARDYQSALIGLKQKVIDYAKEVGGISPEQTTKIIANIDNGSITTAEQVLAQIARDRKVTFIAANGFGNGGTMKAAFATGGLAPGGTVRVGENGPEDVDLPENSYVHNATETERNNAPVVNNYYSTTNNNTINPPPGMRAEDLLKSLDDIKRRGMNR